MKKTLSIVLALAFVVAAFASFALTADSSKINPFKIVSIKVTDTAGYSTPYAAIDNAAAFNENQAAYVVVEYSIAGYDSDKASDYKADSDIFGVYNTTITSSTLDLSYAEATKKYQVKTIGGLISPTKATSTDLTAAGVASGAVYDTFAYDSTNSQLNVKLDLKQYAGKGAANTAATEWKKSGKADVEKYFVAFIGVTKAATAGEIKASLKGSATKFDTYTNVIGTGSAWTAVPGATQVLVVYDSTGVAKYTIYKIGDSYRMFAGAAVAAGDAKSYLFDYVQTGSLFNFIGYAATPSDFTTVGTAVGFTYDGKLVYLGANGKLDGVDDKDLTTAVTDANTFFGFTFATSNAAGNGNFEAKTAGNPTVVTDTYAYVTAAVTTPDTDVDIAPTGDFSANIVIVLMASAVLAAAALAFVAKKARD